MFSKILQKISPSSIWDGIKKLVSLAAIALAYLAGRKSYKDKTIKERYEAAQKQNDRLQSPDDSPDDVRKWMRSRD